MEPRIDVEEYCRAFETWAGVRFDPAEVWPREHARLTRAGCDHLRGKFTGELPVDALCVEFRAWLSGQDPNAVGPLRLAIRKSCLLDRLIYAREPLRPTPCPVHRGHWSGYSTKPCPEGCSFGLNLTGWIR